jgi:hypothetical protein
MRAIATPDPKFVWSANGKEGTMKIASLILALVAAGAIAAFGQEGTGQEIKEGAKKAGEKIKQGAETVGEKTKEAAETVAEKTKETAKTVTKKTKETVEGTSEKAKEATSTTHRKSRKTSTRAKALTTEEQSTNQKSDSPAPTPSGR